MTIILNYSETGTTSLTLLEIVEKFCQRTSIPVPTTAYGSTDTQITQIVALLEEEGNDLTGRGDWQVLEAEATHTTTAAENQGSINTIVANNLRYIKVDTFWDRTENLPVGILDGPDWQAEKGFASTSPRYRVRLRGGELLATPTPPAGNTWAFEYATWNWINDGVNLKKYFTDDTDKPLLPNDILLQGLRWKWKKEKGLEYAEDFSTYEKMVQDALGREGIRKKLYMDSMPKESIPGIVVSQGSWNL